MKIITGLFFILSTGLFMACATYQSKVSASRGLIKQGRLAEASEQLKKLADTPSDDQLVYVLDYATSLQIAGKYKESNDYFLKADALTEKNDYHSVSNIAMSALGSEEMLQYKGESYEKFLINTYLAINYLALNKFDDAMVEVRRVNEKINKIQQDGRKDYEKNAFALYLAGLIWEADGKFDDAYISFSDSYKLDSSNQILREDLIRSAKKARRTDEYQSWKSKFPDVVESKDWYDKSKGELILLVQQGWGPEKHFSPADQRFPKLYATHSSTAQTKLLISGQGVNATELRSKVCYNMESEIIKTMDLDVGWMIARKLGGVAAKAVAADQVRQKNQLLGDLAWIAMRVSDRADLRQWSTLPKNFQIIRAWLPAGQYQFSIKGLDSYGNPTSEGLDNLSVTIKPGRKTFMNWRSLL
jgi:hypothetical protein